MNSLGWSNEFLAQIAAYAGRVPGALIILLATHFIVRSLKRIVQRATQLARIEQTAQSLALSVVGFVGWVVGVAATLNALGLQQISLALGGSVALVAMALASGLNTISQDLLAGIYLLSDEDFAIGTRVRAAGIEGEVVRLSIRKTKLRDKDGFIHVIPNRNIDAATYTILAAAPDQAARTENKPA